MISNECNGCEYKCSLSHIAICTLGSPCPNQRSTPMTEQEYLQTCTTEQLADVFFEYRYVNATPRQKLWMSASEKCIKTDIVEWLKQPHSFEQLSSIFK